MGGLAEGGKEVRGGSGAVGVEEGKRIGEERHTVYSQSRNLISFLRIQLKVCRQLLSRNVKTC